ncbi:MAG: hypothetical protein QNJ91_06655 [Gammaproteobacteria bacterium]|nr:hypothetical protein [Gammaproteobacteria bacterium]
MRVVRRFLLLVAVLLAPLYLLSWFEDADPPAAWQAVDIGDSHAQVRARLRDSGLADRQCEWLAARHAVRCTWIGRHHASGVEVRFDGDGDDARVASVQIREPVYTGPFHLHARLRGLLR